MSQVPSADPLESSPNEPEDFFLAIEKFVNTLEAWQKVIADYRPVAEALGNAAAEPAAPSEFQPSAMDSGFIQI